MAGMPQFNRRKQAILRNANGIPFVVIGETKFMVPEANNVYTEYEMDDFIQLVDGLLWSPSCMSGPNPVMLTRCTLCIEALFGKSHGLLSVRNARLCTCGKTTCPRHRRFVDGSWHCPGCARRHPLAKALSSIFFREDGP